MRDAESVPENDISVLEVGSGVGLDPCWNTLRWFTRGLWYVASCRVNLRIFVCFLLAWCF